MNIVIASAGIAVMLSSYASAISTPPTGNFGLRSAALKSCLTVDEQSATMSASAAFKLDACHPATNMDQQLYLDPVSQGIYKIRSVKLNKCLDILTAQTPSLGTFSWVSWSECSNSSANIKWNVQGISRSSSSSGSFQFISMGMLDSCLGMTGQGVGVPSIVNCVSGNRSQLFDVVTLPLDVRYASSVPVVSSPVAVSESKQSNDVPLAAQNPGSAGRIGTGDGIYLVLENHCKHSIKPWLSTFPFQKTRPDLIPLVHNWDGDLPNGSEGTWVGRVLQPGEIAKKTFIERGQVGKEWSGRVYAATMVDNVPAVGDNSMGADATLAEFHVKGFQNMTFYDVSYIQGYNMPIKIIPTKNGQTANKCIVPSCTITACPSSGSLKAEDGYFTSKCISPCGGNGACNLGDAWDMACAGGKPGVWSYPNNPNPDTGCLEMDTLVVQFCAPTTP
jgi:Thaumatin family